MIQITIQRRDGSIETVQTETEREARSICREEVKWESTQKVICEEICFDEFGDYADK